MYTKLQACCHKSFWSTDRIKDGNSKVKYCPTDKMIADFMSKPLQGSLFKRFRNVIMGWEHTSTLFNVSSSNEERVGDNVKLPVETQKCKLSYAEIVSASTAVENQNRLIANGRSPADAESTPASQPTKQQRINKQ